MRRFIRYIHRIREEISLIFNSLRFKPPYVADVLNYEDYWSQRELEGQVNKLRTRYIFFANLIKEGSKVLDVGCGDGTLLEYLIDKKRCICFGIDISQKAIELTKRKGIPCQLLDLTKDENNLQEEFDYIIFSEVLEHVVVPELLLKKVNNHYRKHLLISIPNSGYISYRLRYLLGRFPVQWRAHPCEHVRFWTVRDFKDWLDAFDLQTERIIPTNGFPFLCRYLPNLFGAQVIFVASKKKN